MAEREKLRQQITVLRKPIREAIQRAVDRIKKLIAGSKELAPDDYSKKLRTELNSLNRLRSQLSSQDNSWLSTLDEKVSVAQYEFEYGGMNRFGRILDEGQAIIEDELEKVRRARDTHALPAQGAPGGDDNFSRTMNVTQLLNDSHLEDVLQRLTVVQEQQTTKPASS